MARIGRRRSRPLVLPEITLTPLIDTALTLLIIFMIATPMMQNSIKINLPEGTVKEAGDPQPELTVQVDRDKKIIFAGKTVSINDLVKQVRAKVAHKKEQTIFVNAARESNYGDVLKIVDQLKGIKGISYVALATVRPAA